MNRREFFKRRGVGSEKRGNRRRFARCCHVWTNSQRDAANFHLALGDSYGFGETRVALVALLTFTVPAGSIAGGVVTTKFSGHAVSFRSSPTLAADIPISRSTTTR